MKYIVPLVIFLIGCKSKQFVSKEMILIPSQKFKYILDEEKRSVFVSSYYISRFPERNKDYRIFLNSLPSNEKSKAIPQLDFLKENGLTLNQINFLINNYYYDIEFENYPIIGLNKRQIQKYLKWKFETKGKQILSDNNINYDENKSYIEIVESQNIKDKLLLTTFNILTTAQAISACKYSVNQKNKKTISSSHKDILTNKIIKSLGIKECKYYDISNYTTKSELIYNQIDSLNHYKSVKRIKSYIFKTKSERNATVPLRTWNLKM